MRSFGNCVYFAIDSREEAASISQTYVYFYKGKIRHSLIKRRFTLSLSAVDCGGNYTESYGTIQTPTYPDIYHNDANCTWLITVAENRVVDLK